MFFRDLIVSVMPLSPTRARVAIHRALGAPVVEEIEQPAEFKTLTTDMEQWRDEFTKEKEALKRSTAHLLYTTFFQGELAHEFKKRRAQEGNLRIKIQADADAEDDALSHWFFQTPWELMIEPKASMPLSIAPDLSFIRQCDAQQPFTPHFPLPLADGLRILILTANTPESDEPIDEQHFNQPIIRIGASHASVQVKVLEQPSLFTLKQALESFRPHILHITAHGDKPSPRTETREERPYDALGLLFVTKSDTAGKHVIGAAELLALLKPSLNHLRLVTLASCYLGRAGTRDLEGGFAASLCAGGVPAVAAFQFAVHYKAAVLWLKTFYGRLAQGDRLDTAMISARSALYSEFTEGRKCDIEFGSPVLFSRLSDGRLFRQKQHVKVVSRVVEQNNPLDEDIDLVDLTEFFGGPDVKNPQLVNGADWNETLYPQLSGLTRRLSGAMPIRFEGPAHLSMFVVLGFIFNETRNFEVGVVQVNKAIGSQKNRAETWWSSTKPEPTALRFEQIEGTNAQGDLVVCISTTSLTKPGAERFFTENDLNHRALLHWQPQNGFADSSIPNQGVALHTARAIGVKIKQVAQELDVPHIHLFFAGPSGLALFLGMQLNGCPPIRLYEYMRDQNAYGPSFLIPPPTRKEDKV